jgi:hypothetical protein
MRIMFGLFERLDGRKITVSIQYLSVEKVCYASIYSEFLPFASLPLALPL